MKLLVTGSREWDNEVLLEDWLDDVAQHEPIMLLVVGDCPTGADAQAWEWAGHHGVERIQYRANWDLYGKAAGPKRNRAMVDEESPDLCLAFLKEGAGNRGTWQCAGYAKDQGVPVVEIYG